ncbi:MAG: class I SAM-dependent methyltransferase [Candidatus Dormibacteria bacterium]
MESMHQQPAEMDCIMMVDVLEHLVDPQAALERCRHWLVPGGTLAVSTVNITAPMARLMGTRWPGFMDMHLTYFSAPALRAMFKRAGLTPVWLGPTARPAQVRSNHSEPRRPTGDRATGRLGRTVLLMGRWHAEDGKEADGSTGLAIRSSASSAVEGKLA